MNERIQRTKESSEKVQERQRDRGITRGMESKIRIENGQREGEGGNGMKGKEECVGRETFVIKLKKG